MRTLRLLAALLTLLAAGLTLAPAPGAAQQGQQQWFVPGQQQQPQQRPPVQQQQQRPGAPAPGAQAPAQQRPQAAPQGQVAGPQEPGAPRLPPIARGEPPPAALIGVVGLPEVFEASVAARGVRQTVQERLQRLNDEAQREQGAWREAQQQLANQRATLTADQLRDRERELQERITNGQRILRERNATIQQAGQRSLGEVERTALYVIGQVAESRNLNIVLNRGAVVLAVDAMDITAAVVEQLNRALPAVEVEPEPGAAPAATAQPQRPAPAAQQRPAAQPPAQQRPAQPPQRN
ncbi:OmpH family outer membrane protein [Elioraea sp.]|uniref:OmpH family outer membrane protein n=1 Tax=Elioraea sp. TaxID=2185103 RepID=UPI0025B9F3E1|nr:OmpH family outer membrane protein [Elioraea sp.]